MEKRIKLLTGLLAGSLALNIYSISRANSLEAGIQNVNRNVSSINQTLYNELGSLAGRIDQMQKGANWIAKADFKPKQEASSPSEIHLDLEWSFREVEQDANVFLLYRSQAEGEWIEVPAEQIGKGNFGARLVLSPKEQYEYKIVSEGSTLKTGETTVVPVKYYRPSPLITKGISTSGSNGQVDRLEAEFSQIEPVIFDFFKIKEAYVEVMNNGNVAQTLPLQREPSLKDDYPQNREAYKFVVDMNKDITALVLEVTYGDGTTQKGEIYPNNVYMNNLGRELKVN